MRSKILPMALAVLLAGSLAACAPADENAGGGGGIVDETTADGGGGGMAPAQRRAEQAPERAAEQEPLGGRVRVFAHGAPTSPGTSATSPMPTRAPPGSTPT